MDTNSNASPPATAAATDTSGPADVAAATTFSPSGAPHQTAGIDVDHPAVDNNPRENTTADMNRIDFNDPAKSGAEIAAEQLKAGKAKGKTKD